MPCQTPSPPKQFAEPVMVCKLAANNANDLNMVLNLTSPCLLCGFPQTECGTNEMCFGTKGMWPPKHL